MFGQNMKFHCSDAVYIRQAASGCTVQPQFYSFALSRSLACLSVQCTKWIRSFRAFLEPCSTWWSHKNGPDYYYAVQLTCWMFSDAEGWTVVVHFSLKIYLRTCDRNLSCGSMFRGQPYYFPALIRHFFYFTLFSWFVCNSLYAVGVWCASSAVRMGVSYKIGDFPRKQLKQKLKINSQYADLVFTESRTQTHTYTIAWSLFRTHEFFLV